MSTIEDVLTPLSDQESSRVSMPSVVELKGAGLIKAIKIGSTYNLIDRPSDVRCNLCEINKGL